MKHRTDAQLKELLDGIINDDGASLAFRQEQLRDNHSEKMAIMVKRLCMIAKLDEGMYFLSNIPIPFYCLNLQALRFMIHRHASKMKKYIFGLSPEECGLMEPQVIELLKDMIELMRHLIEKNHGTSED